MNQKYPLIFALLLFLSRLLLPAQDFHWAKTIGGAGGDFATAVQADPSGNVVFAVHYHDSCDMDPGPLVALRNGYIEAAILKMDPVGNLLWHRTIGDVGYGYSYVHDIVVDAAGNIYATGMYAGECTWEGINNTTSDSVSTSHNWAFLAKYSASGELLWLSRWGSPVEAGTAEGVTLARAPNGHLYVAGICSGVVDYNPGPGVWNYNSTSHAFILHLDSVGGYVNIIRLMSVNTGMVGAHDIAVDGQGRVYLSGGFSGSVDFDPGVTWQIRAPQPANSSSSNTFILRLNPDDSFNKFIQWTGSSATESQSMAMDASGQVHIAGYFTDTFDADPGPGTQLWTAAPGTREGFVAKIDTGMSLAWALRYPSDLSMEMRGLNVDAQGNAYCAGAYIGNADLDPGPGVLARSALQSLPGMFVSKLNPAGVMQWTGVMPPLGSWQPNTLASHVKSLAVGQGGEIYAGGIHSGLNDHNSGPGQLTLPSVDNYDAFIQRWHQCSTSTVGIIQQAAACASYTWPLNNVTYFQSGSYTLMPPTTADCDSMATLQLTIYPGADSVEHVTTCEGSSYVWPVTGLTYASAGTYQVQGTSVQGCDSNHTLVLSQVALVPNVTQNGGTLTAQTAGATYQWYVCGTPNQAIPGATGQSFTPGSPGSYAVWVSLPGIGCQDTSNCYTFTISGVQDPMAAIRAYPNPSAGTLHVAFGATLEEAQISLCDLAGRALLEKTVYGEEGTTLGMPLAAGCYLLRVTHAGGSSVLRVMRE